MPGLVPGIQWDAALDRQTLLDCRDEPGNEEKEETRVNAED